MHCHPSLCLIAPLLAVVVSAQQPVPLDVVVIAAKTAPRTEQITADLRTAKMRVRHVDLAACEPATLWKCSAVVVDWPSDRDLPTDVELMLARWHRPTVFVGDCGERFARAWQLPTPAEMAAREHEALGPAMQSVAIAKAGSKGTAEPVWRHGHLFYLPTRAWQSKLLPTVSLAARFVSDRPIVRRASDEDRERRERVKADAATLGITLSDSSALFAALRNAGPNEEKALLRLLTDVVVGGREYGTSRNNWLSWLKGRATVMHWDLETCACYVDELSRRRGAAPPGLRGEARADGRGRDAEALAIASKVVGRYGGHALRDTRTLSYRERSVTYLWDREHGIFRMENHHQVKPGARATAWKVSVLDTFADQELIWGGGPPPRPRVSARAKYRNAMQRTLLPLRLLDPGMSLQVLADESSPEQVALAVEMAGRGLDLRTTFVLTIERATGDVVRMEQRAGGRMAGTYVLEGVTACGPLTLPSSWRLEGRRRRPAFTIEDVKWNPDLPEGLATATDYLTTSTASK